MTSLACRDVSVLTLKMRENFKVGSIYLTFVVCTWALANMCSDGSYSSVLTLGSGIQCLGFCALLQKVRQTKSVAGISKKTVQLYGLVLVLRLCSTLQRSGYIPVDRSGDWVYQSADLTSLLFVLELLLCFEEPRLRATYQEEYDTMDLVKMVPACCMLAFFVHGNLNDSVVFDTVWTASMNVDTVSMLPQLWMLAKIGGEVEGMTAHFVVALMLSRACSFAFWVYGYKELGKVRRLNVAGYQLLAAHFIQLGLSADFLLHYLSARLKGRRMVLPGL